MDTSLWKHWKGRVWKRSANKEVPHEVGLRDSLKSIHLSASTGGWCSTFDRSNTDTVRLHLKSCNSFFVDCFRNVLFHQEVWDCCRGITSLEIRQMDTTKIKKSIKDNYKLPNLDHEGRKIASSPESCTVPSCAEHDTNKGDPGTSRRVGSGHGVWHAKIAFSY